MKLVNFASLDPSITNSGRKGLSGSSKKDREIWDEFHNDWEKLTVECEKLRGFLGIPSNLEITDSTESEEIDMTDYTGDTRVAIIQQRMKQNFFRRAVLAREPLNNGRRKLGHQNLHPSFHDAACGLRLGLFSSLVFAFSASLKPRLRFQGAPVPCNCNSGILSNTRLANANITFSWLAFLAKPR